MRSLLVATLAALLAGAACPAKKDAPPASAPPVRAAPPDAGDAHDIAVEAPLFAPQPEGKRVAVLFTASVQGYVEPCGCTAEPLGGVARLAAAVDDAKRAYGERVVFVDAGDLLFERDDDTAAADACQAKARADLLVSTYARKGLAATVLGPLDDVRGPSFRDARLAQHGVTTVGVNPPRALGDGAQHASGVVRQAGPAKIGVTGFRADAPADVAAAKQALTAEVARLREAGVDAIVVLAQAPRAASKAVASGVPGIDVVIQGRAPGEVPAAPERLDTGALLVASGMQAQHLGVLELVLDGRVPWGAAAPRPALALDDRAAARERSAKILAVRVQELDKQVQQTEGARKEFLAQRLAAARAELDRATSAAPDAPLEEPHVVARAIPLPRGAAEEPRARDALAAYQKEVPALVATCEATLVCPEPAPGAATFVGAASCKACHAPAHAFWEQQTVRVPAKDRDGKEIVRVSGHAKAWETLVHDDKDTDRTCVGCHSVGFGVPGGACKTTDIVPRGLAGVQCESCHGAGSLHAAAPSKANIVRATSEETCRACHRVPHIPTTESFVFGDRLKLITGPGHGG